jgi:glycosyltransferase involved in cell wall biosynthesis
MGRLRVAVDARRLQDHPYTGVGRRIANFLPFEVGSVDVVLLTDKRRAPTGLAHDGNDGRARVEEVALAMPPRLREPFWLQGPVARWLHSFDGVFHGTYNALPLVHSGPSVVTIHDLSFVHHPEDMGRGTQASFAFQARSAARRARVVITPSEHVRQSVIDTYHLNPEKVVSIPPGSDPQFSPDRRADVVPLLQRLGIDRPYVVAMGGAPRRGLEVAIAAWDSLPPGPDRPLLVVIGAQVPPPMPGVIHAGRIEDGEWSALLAGAEVFCYPTRFEGYGMPALEAAASGVPIVCARLGPLPEVLGDAAQWCDAPTVESIREGLSSLLADPVRRAALRAAGLARAEAAPTWAQGATEELNAYQKAAG